MKLYNELADWWHLLSPPAEYEEEAHLYLEIIRKYKRDVANALELGCGGGNNAFYLKKHFQMTLTDISPEMLRVSQRLNPECTHRLFDMRYARLDQKFDLVFIHDAITYITTKSDLKKVFQVARNHLNRNGLLFIMPDHYAETFRPTTGHGGHDGPDRGLRYLEWTFDSDPYDNIVEVEYAYLLKKENGDVQVIHDTSINGIFPKKTWKDLLEETGFKVTFEEINYSDQESNTYLGIIGIKQ